MQLTAHACRDKPSDSHCFTSIPVPATCSCYMLAPSLQNMGTLSLSTWPATFSSLQPSCPGGQGANPGRNCWLPDLLDEKGGLRLGMCSAGGNESPGLSSLSTLVLDPSIPRGHLGPVGAELCAMALGHQQVYKWRGHTKCLQSHDLSLFLILWADSYDGELGSCTSAGGTSLVLSDCSIGQDWPFDPGPGYQRLLTHNYAARVASSRAPFTIWNLHQHHGRCTHLQLVHICIHSLPGHTWPIPPFAEREVGGSKLLQHAGCPPTEP